jgi:hypothetical protein
MEEHDGTCINADSAERGDHARDGLRQWVPLRHAGESSGRLPVRIRAHMGTAGGLDRRDLRERANIPPRLRDARESSMIVHTLNRNDFGAHIIRADGSGTSTHTLVWTDYVTGEWHETYASERLARERLAELERVCDNDDGFTTDIVEFTSLFGDIGAYVVEIGTYGDETFPSSETVEARTTHTTLDGAMSDATWHADHYGLSAVTGEYRWVGHDQNNDLDAFIRIVPIYALACDGSR